MKILVLLLVLATSAGSAQPIIPGKSVGLTREAVAQIDSIAKKTLRERREQIACVQRYGVEDTVFVIDRLSAPRNVVGSDSLHVFAIGDPCWRWQPVLHSHFITLGVPSGLDYRTSALRGVFEFLLSVKRDSTWTLRAYP